MGCQGHRSRRPCGRADEFGRCRRARPELIKEKQGDRGTGLEGPAVELEFATAERLKNEAEHHLRPAEKRRERVSAGSEGSGSAAGRRRHSG